MIINVEPIAWKYVYLFQSPPLCTKLNELQSANDDGRMDGRGAWQRVAPPKNLKIHSENIRINLLFFLKMFKCHGRHKAMLDVGCWFIVTLEGCATYVLRWMHYVHVLHPIRIPSSSSGILNWFWVWLLMTLTGYGWGELMATATTTTEQINVNGSSSLFRGYGLWK